MKGFFSALSNKKRGLSSGALPSAKLSVPQEDDVLDPALTALVTDAAFSSEGRHFVGGSFQRCVEYIFVRDTDQAERALLYCFRPFGTPAELFRMLTAINEQPQVLKAWGKESPPERIKARLCRMLLEWINMGFSFDFQPDPKLVKLLHKTTKELMPSAEQNRIKLMLLKGKVDPHGLCFPDENASVKDDDMVELVTGARFFLQQDAEAIAHEVSYIEYELYHSIEASELMNKNWQRENAAELSPNLVGLRKRFNQLSFWVITIVLKSEAKQQVKMVKHLLDCCWALYQMRNYNGLGALQSGLNSISLARLKYLWEGLSKQDLKRREEMNAALDGNQNFKQYRSLLEDHAKHEVACIPYIPLHLRDILTIYEREENHVNATDSSGKPMVNFDKMMALGTSMHTVLQFRAVQWKPSQDSTLRDYLLRVTFMSEDDLLLLSDSWKERVVQAGSHTPSPSLTPRSSNVSSDGSAPRALKTRSFFNRVLIVVSYDNWLIHCAFPVDGTFKDLKKVMRSCCGKEVDLFYTTSSGLSLFLDSQKEMGDFLYGSEKLLVTATNIRGTISRLSSPLSRPGSSKTLSRRGSSQVYLATRDDGSPSNTSPVSVSPAGSYSSLPLASPGGAKLNAEMPPEVHLSVDLKKRGRTTIMSADIFAAPDAKTGSSPKTISPSDSFSAVPGKPIGLSESGSLPQHYRRNELAVSPTSDGASRPRSGSLNDFNLSASSLSASNSATASPLMSPRGDEKKRLLVLDLRDNATNPEIAVPLHLDYEEFRALLSLIYLREDIVVSFEERGTRVDIHDDANLLRALKSGKSEHGKVLLYVEAEIGATVSPRFL